MGSSVSHAAAPPPPAPASPLGLAVALPPKADEAKEKQPEKVDYLNLPCPVPFEEIQREALSELLDLFSFLFVRFVFMVFVVILMGRVY